MNHLHEAVHALARWRDGAANATQTVAALRALGARDLVARDEVIHRRGRPWLHRVAQGPRLSWSADGHGLALRYLAEDALMVPCQNPGPTRVP